MVADVIRETPDTSTIIFFTGNDHLDYAPGHFLTIEPHQFPALERWTAYLEDQKGRREPPRAYSMASSPDEHHLAITVKEERYVTDVTKYPPLLSPILAYRTVRGTKMKITGFAGPYTLPKDGVPESILHICAGSGIVPNWSILKYCLRNHPDMKHRLIYSNKTWADTIFGEGLLDLQRQFPENLEIVFTITREDTFLKNGATLQKGRITRDLIEKTIEELDNPMLYVCGPALSKWDKLLAKKNGTTPPPRFMESALGLLEDLGVDKKSITKESYG